MQSIVHLRNRMGVDSRRTGTFHPLLLNARKYPALYVMAATGVIWFITFRYIPMLGLVMSFQDFRLARGIWRSEWIGLANFSRFLRDPYFFRVIRNSFLIAIYTIVWGFWPPIFLALTLNEVKNVAFKRIAQSISYLPYFISTVVVVGMLRMLTASDGVINNLIVNPLTGQRIPFLIRPEWFRTLYVGSGIWQNIGWGSIIYLAAISTIDPDLYEAAKIDGANRLQCIGRITIPLLAPTIKVLFVLQLGTVIRVGFEKVYLMYSTATYETADVISTYVYRVGILSGSDYGYASAVGMFESVVSLLLIIIANFLAKRLSGEGVF